MRQQVSECELTCIHVMFYTCVPVYIKHQLPCRVHVAINFKEFLLFAPCFLSSPSFSSIFLPSMALNISHHQLIALLWISLILLLLHQYLNNVKPFIINYHRQHITAMRYSTLLIPRKVLARKFDFSPFKKSFHHHVESRGKDISDEETKNEIDPPYGVEKRLVPTGPNPLHH
ncbi:hypothetical protein SAY86_032157 [Trapa natans]|uniref:Uncharacterized protein n=1 Tax=Trapa natans TaxID=22666 RepID=A0AAN7LVB8_TRANT|nr:hypothetical protein SAY86_032157 [Trapa natans]